MPAKRTLRREDSLAAGKAIISAPTYILENFSFPTVKPAMANSLFNIESTPDKGVGAFACSSISRGTLILSEKPLFKIPLFAQDPMHVQNILVHSLRTLDKAQQRKFLELSNNFPQLNPFAGIAKTNAMPLGVDAEEGGIFPMCSRFNHSCVGNASYCWNARLGEERIYAVKTIGDNEEILVNYLPNRIWLAKKSVRQEQIDQEFGFVCRCQICNGSADSIAQSDQRRVELAEFNDAVGNGILIMTDPSRALKSCRRALDLLREEGVSDMKTQAAYYDAFQICIVHGDLARAAAFASVALKAKIECQGSDADGAEELTIFTVTPAKHRLAGKSNRWRSKIKDRRSEDAPDFEDWLWQKAG